MESLTEAYLSVRQLTESLAAPLAPEDQVVQSMPDASPTKWHRAHTTWFFETFWLAEAAPSYERHHPACEGLFNSYYNRGGEQFSRPRRGLLSRPTVAEVAAYRSAVDDAVLERLSKPEPLSDALRDVLILGLHHEQQHQELLLTDIKHMLSQNPLHPVYAQRERDPEGVPSDVAWSTVEPGLKQIGFAGEGFSFDNEGPPHKTWIEGVALASRLVTVSEYREFMNDGGYDDPRHWLSAGWDAVRSNGWRAPLYWVERDGDWHQFTLSGLRPVRSDEPVCHVSYFEADAFARWSGARLPTEQEWEVAAADEPIEGNFVESGALHPIPAGSATQRYGDVWEWTQSQYSPYPGYRAAGGALGEYNGKFMCNQFVLRGGACATPKSHMRLTYRNFFPPDARWQFSGIRLAKDLTR